MKTNVPVELTDQERDILANKIDGKKTSRLATRAEVCAITLRLFDLVIHEPTRQPTRTDTPRTIEQETEFDEMFNRACGGNFNPILNPPAE